MPLNKGRPRTRGPIRRYTLDLDEELANAVIALMLPQDTFRSVIEAGLRLWLAEHEPEEEAEQPEQISANSQNSSS